MLFHSQLFLLAFLPITLALYYGFARHARTRQWLLVAASLIFYSWWDVRFAPLLLGQVLMTWCMAGLYFQTFNRWLILIAIVANLAVLGLFKYLDFLVGLAEQALGVVLPRSELILPIGISFYTFQLISYLIDALRRDAPRYELRTLTLFVVLFPHLIAGPIVRHNEIIPQFALDPLRPGVPERISRGLALLVAGIAAKVFLADSLARIADPVFATAERAVPVLSDAVAGTLAFALQIFFDFAAYSDMAIGIALMMGLRFPINFNQPYRATSIREFWRTWHMTLSRFLRDYVYIPLGGSREGAGRYIVASLATMGLCGLWHGAGWTFIIWGLAHGVGLVVCRFWHYNNLPMPRWLGWALTFIFVVVLFGLFRAPDLTSAYRLGMGLVGGGDLGRLWSGQTFALLAIAGGLALMPWTSKELVDRWLAPAHFSAAMLAAAAFYAVLVVGEGQPKTFIYFQF